MTTHATALGALEAEMENDSDAGGERLPVGVEIYVGAPIQYGSERRTLRAVVELLRTKRCEAVLLANFHIRDRQIDLVVATDNRLVVIEAKGTARAVRGGKNGPWETETAGGSRRERRNAYDQALTAKFAVRDATPALWRGSQRYPAGAVVFVPGLPDGSEIPEGDFKVCMIDLDDLGKTLALPANCEGAMAEVRRMADELRCTRVSTVAEACDPVLAEHARFVRAYGRELLRAYGPSGRPVPFECQSVDGSVLPSIDVRDRVAGCRQDVLVLGGSGRGKTMLAQACAMEFVRRGGVALMIAVKDYDGDLRRVLDTEAALLGASSARDLLKACRVLSRQVLFVVDGYNECSAQRREGLARRVAALVRRYAARVLVTSQCGLTRSDLLKLETIEVTPTSTETKTAIAKEVLGGATIPADLQRLLRSVRSGLEARIATEAGLDVSEGAGRFRLFDAFARRRLGGTAMTAIRLASTIAGWMSQRVVFSMSVRDLDRLLVGESDAQHAVRALEDGGLLDRRGDRVSFSHESYLDAFAAEAAVRDSGGDAGNLLSALRSPLHARRKELVVGAIDDHVLLYGLLERLDDAEAIRECLSGACGALAEEWAASRCVEILEKVREEVRAARIGAVGDSYFAVNFDEGALSQWSGPEMAFLIVLPRMIWRGDHLEEILEIVGALDQRLLEERRRLAAEDVEGVDTLADRLFGRTYVLGGGKSPGLSLMCRGIHSGAAGFLERGQRVSPKRLRRVLTRYGMGEGLTAGQMYLVLRLCGWQEPCEGFVAHAIRKGWSRAPYHLRCLLLDAAELAAPGTERGRRDLHDALRGLPDLEPVLNGQLLNALASVGGLDQEEGGHRAVARAEVAECVGTLGEFAEREAWRLYTCQFDHPFAMAYWDAIHELPDDGQKRLMALAARAAEPDALGADTLVAGLVSWRDEALCGTISRFAVPPPEDVPGPTYAVRTFVIAHAGLGRLRCRLAPHEDAPGSSAAALAACGRLVYWSNRPDVDASARRDACQESLDALVSRCRDRALDAVLKCQFAGSTDMDMGSGEQPLVWSVAEVFGKDLVDVCREALRRPDKQKGCFEDFSDEDRWSCLSLAMDLLGRHGNSMDASLVRGLVQDPELGRSAVSALKAMEARGAMS